MNKQIEKLKEQKVQAQTKNKRLQNDINYAVAQNKQNQKALEE